MSKPSIPIKQARVLLYGFRQGAFDEYDLASIFEFGTDWLDKFGSDLDPHDEVAVRYGAELWPS